MHVTNIPTGTDRLKKSKEPGVAPSRISGKQSRCFKSVVMLA